MTAQASEPRIIEAPVVHQQVLPDLRVELQKGRHRIPLSTGGYVEAVRKGPVGPSWATVVLIHGFAQKRYTYHLPGWSMTGWLASQGVDTWNIEMRGIGRSAAHSRLTRTIDTYVQKDFPDLVEHIARTVGRPIFVIGHSLGAFTLYAGAPSVRRWLRGGIGIAGLIQFGQKRMVFEALQRLWPVVPGVVDRGLHLPTQPPAWMLGTAPFTQLLDSRAWSASPVRFWHPGTMDRQRLKWWLRNGFAPAPLGVFRQLASSAGAGRFTSFDGRVDYLDRWQRQADPLPTLIVTPDRDAFISPGDARATFEQTPGNDKEFQVIGESHGGHHWGHVDIIHGDDAPEYVWPVLLDWLQRHA